MPVDYAEVLNELEAEEARLLTELKLLQAAKPAIQALKKKAADFATVTKMVSGRFFGMGATKAIPLLLEGHPVPLNYREIHDALKAEGWTTASSDPMATVSATLSQLKDSALRKVGEGWVLKESEPTFVDSEITDDDIPF